MAHAGEKRDKELVQQVVEERCQFVGYGAPDAKLWVCGIEEHGEKRKQYDDNWLLNQVGVERPPFEPSFTDNKIISTSAWGYSFRLAAKIEGIPNSEFQKRWTEDASLLVLTNFYVLPKSRQRKWHSELVTRGEYEEIVRRERYRTLRMRRPSGSVVVCHGKSLWDEFEKAFVTPGDTEEFVFSSDKKRHLKLFRQSKVILSPFFVPYHMPDDLFGILCEGTQELWHP
jgi:hypothetical protein